MTVDQIIALAQASGLVLLVTALLVGQVWAKPAVDFIRTMLTDSLARESKLADALGDNTTAMRELRRAPGPDAAAVMARMRALVARKPRPSTRQLAERSAVQRSKTERAIREHENALRALDAAAWRER